MALNTWTIALTLITVASACALAGWIWWLRRPPMLSRRVIVNLVSDPDHAVSGVLWDTRGTWLVLRDAAVLQSDGRATPMDGELVVDRRNIAFVQVPAAVHGHQQLRSP